MYESYNLEINNSDDLIGELRGFTSDELKYLESFLRKGWFNNFNYTKYIGKKLSFIDMLYVYDESRGTGIGTNLLTQAIETYKTIHLSDYIILICRKKNKDKYNTFSVNKWYKRFKFKEVACTDNNILMILNCKEC